MSHEPQPSSHLLEVRPSVVSGECVAPPSKSETHRAFLLAAQAPQGCRVEHPLLAEDTRSTLSCLQALGARANLDHEDVHFMPGPLRPTSGALDCGNSGTTLRLLCATVARFPTMSILTGDPSLRRRPNGPLLESLRSLGATCTSSDGRAPIHMRGPLRSGIAELPARTSSQFASALLLSLPFVPGSSTVQVAAPVSSRPYIDVTMDIAHRAGLRIDGEATIKGLQFRCVGGQAVTSRTLEVAGDWSAAAFPLVAASVTGGAIRVRGLDPHSLQADRSIVSVLQSFGVNAHLHDDGASAMGYPSMTPGRLDVGATPDLFPALCVLAAVAPGTTELTNAGALRTKESDRIAAMAEGLAAFGVETVARPDALVVHGRAHGLRSPGDVVPTKGDHRVHMALAVAALAAPQTSRLDHATSAHVSYPSFHRDLAQAGAAWTVLHGRRNVVGGAA